MLTGAAVSVRTSIRITVIIISRRIITAKPTLPCSKDVARADCRHFFFSWCTTPQIIGKFPLSLPVTAQYYRYYGAVGFNTICYLYAYLCRKVYASYVATSAVYGESVCLEVWIALNLFIRVKIKFQ